MRLPSIPLITFATFAFTLFVSAFEPALKPRHDPPDQLFRRAPMSQAARSVAVNLATNLHYAFDTERPRIHTIWRGSPLNLWGPQYSYSKARFICDFDGETLYAFPQVSPWWSEGAAAETKFLAMKILGNEVVFDYLVRTSHGSIPVSESLRGTASEDRWIVHRSFRFPHGNPGALSFLAFAERGAVATGNPDELQIRGTNGVARLRALSGASPLQWTVTNTPVRYASIIITEEGTEKGFITNFVTGPEMRAYFSVPARQEEFSVEFTLGSIDPATAPDAESGTPQRKAYSASRELRAAAGDESYKIEYFPLPPEAELLVTGMDWLNANDLALCTWLGEIYFVRNATGDVRKATYHRFARGLNEPLGLAVHEGQIYVVQKGELTRVTDSDGDELADRFECISNAWGYSGNYHSYSFGPLITAEDDFLVFITGQRGLYNQPYQGWALEVGHDNHEITPFCSGLRVPHGCGLFGPAHDVFVTDNQGNWIGACRLNHLQRGKFYGFPSSIPSPRQIRKASEVEPPVLWFPRSLSPSASGFDTISDNRFGPFSGQMLIGDFQNSIVMRACLEQVGGRWQGAVFPFARGFLSGINRLKMGPDGRLYVGGGKRTWSTAAPKEFSLDRLNYTGKIPFEVGEVHAANEGFVLKFTHAVDKKSAADPANYLIKQFTYVYHEAYGSPEIDHSGKEGATEIPVLSATPSEDGVSVRLKIPSLRSGYVTSFQLALSSADDADLRNDTFYYTLNAQPLP